MKKVTIVLTSMFLVFLLAACGSSVETASDAGESSGSAVESNSNSQSTSSGSAAAEKVRLSDDFADAVPVQTQLAVGTMQLEETDLAIDETLAAELLPLWRAVQSLSNSETAAQVEIDAVINQIQDTMSPEQVTAIADMRLTEETITAMLEEGDLAFGPGGRGFSGGNSGDSATGGGQGARGFFGGGPGGGPPPGGFPGGGPGGGFGNLSEDDIATRQAQFAEGGFGAFRERAMMGAVIRLLEVKTGEAPEGGFRGIFGTVFAIVSEATGLSVEDLQAQTAEGSTLAEIVEANGGDVEAVRASLVEAINDLPNAVDLDAEQLASDWLGLSQ